LCREIQDLAPLRGMKLSYLGINGCNKIRDFEPIREMPLTTLCMNQTRLGDLTVLSGLKKLENLQILDCPEVKDLSGLDGLQLKTIHLTPRFVQKGMEVLRRMKSLDSITVDANRTIKAGLFWKLHDRGELPK
jgi:hypothetical protein